MQRQREIESLKAELPTKIEARQARCDLALHFYAARLEPQIGNRLNQCDHAGIPKFFNEFMDMARTERNVEPPAPKWTGTPSEFSGKWPVWAESIDSPPAPL